MGLFSNWFRDREKEQELSLPQITNKSSNILDEIKSSSLDGATKNALTIAAESLFEANKLRKVYKSPHPLSLEEPRRKAEEWPSIGELDQRDFGKELDRLSSFSQYCKLFLDNTSDSLLKKSKSLNDVHSFFLQWRPRIQEDFNTASKLIALSSSNIVSLDDRREKKRRKAANT